MPGLLQQFAQDLPDKTVGARDEGAMHDGNSLMAVAQAGEFNRPDPPAELDRAGWVA